LTAKYYGKSILEKKKEFRKDELVPGEQYVEMKIRKKQQKNNLLTNNK
jgi:hypothetical protein